VSSMLSACVALIALGTFFVLVAQGPAREWSLAEVQQACTKHRGVQQIVFPPFVTDQKDNYAVLVVCRDGSSWGKP
jgi:hypothetical protein